MTAVGDLYNSSRKPERVNSQQSLVRKAGDTPQVLNPQSLLAGDDYVSV
jgi:hypothetical protein